MEKFYDGFGKEYIKPKDKDIRKRNSVYALVYIKDIDKYLFINNIPEKSEFFKLTGGGMKKGESIKEALNREFIEEIGYPLNKFFIEKKKLNYTVNFKPLRKTDEYWYNNQSFILYEVENFKDTGYPNENQWICDNENIPCRLISKDYILNNMNNFHYTIKKALNYFLK